MEHRLTLTRVGAAVNWKERVRAAGLHFGMGLLVCALAGALVLGIWYPAPYRELSGGRELFFLLMSVDVVLGPLLTLCIFDSRKGWPVLRRDLLVIVSLQVAALGYGLWTAAQARPVHLVFEKDRYLTVHAIEVRTDLLAQAAPGIVALPLTGPTLLSLRPPRDEKEKVALIMEELAGAPAAARPDHWQPYELALPDVRRSGKPLAALFARFPGQQAEAEALLRKAGVAPERAAWLPIQSRKGFWTALVDTSNGHILGYLPVDPL